jgi:ribose-phosphate pyrophosphokinase
MILCGDPSNKKLSEAIAKRARIEFFYPEVTVFPDTEQRVRIPQTVQGDKVFLLKSILRPVDSSVLQLTFTVDALNRSGADKVIGIIPYIPYMRADHVFRTGEAVPLELVIKMIEDSGLNEIIMVDPHSIKIPEMFKITVHNLSALSLFAKRIKDIEPKRENITIVSPDMGGIRRLEQLDNLLGGGVNQVVVNKDRNYESGEIKVAEYKGKIKGKCFIVDDIISTGKTVNQAIDTLDQGGAEAVYVFGTHAVFSEDADMILARSKAKEIYVTDSIPVPEEKRFEKLQILSLADLIAQELKD